MDRKEVAACWERNADAWTKLSRAGYDVYRDSFNTPAFLELLPDVDGLDGLDIGCGEGHNTRCVAQRGARMTAIDVAETFVRHAREQEEQAPLGIDCQIPEHLLRAAAPRMLGCCYLHRSVLILRKIRSVSSRRHSSLPGVMTAALPAATP